MAVEKEWRENQGKQKIEECELALQAHDQKDQWCIDNGCSRHMTGDKNHIHKIERNSGSWK